MAMLHQIYITALVITTLCICAECKTTLSATSMYTTQKQAQTCLNNIWRISTQRFVGIQGAVPNCLRLAFHDAGTYTTASDDGGANGSVLRELAFSQNAGLNICGNLMNTIINDIRATAGCGLTSIADIIQVTGAAAVYMSGGPACSMVLGRPDRASGTDSPNGLPSACQTVSSLVDTFKNAGFSNPTTSLVVLSGAHNIGQSRATPQSACSRGLGGLGPGNNRFDGHYYQTLTAPTAKPGPVRGQGWFFSDNQLLVGGNTVTAALVRQYSANPAQFLADWCPHYQEMSMLGVTPATGFGFMLPAQLPPRGAPAGRRAGRM